jgi:hypothetical protein
MRLSLKFYVLSALVLASFSASLMAQTAVPARTDDAKKAYKAAMEDADQKIADEIKSHSDLMKNLEHLTTEIGPRLTGSKQMQQASDWTLKRFHDYGIDAHLETTEIPHAYYRGVDTAEIIAPIEHDTGTGKVFSIALENLYETAPLMGEIYEPLREIFNLQPLSTRYFGSSDHVAFLRAGVPSYFCIFLHTETGALP